MFFFFQAEDGIRDYKVTGVQTCALPICGMLYPKKQIRRHTLPGGRSERIRESAKWKVHCFRRRRSRRSEEHTSELQSPCNLVCRLLLEKKKQQGPGRPLSGRCMVHPIST